MTVADRARESRLAHRWWVGGDPGAPVPWGEQGLGRRVSVVRTPQHWLRWPDDEVPPDNEIPPATEEAWSQGRGRGAGGGHEREQGAHVADANAGVRQGNNFSSDIMLHWGFHDNWTTVGSANADGATAGAGGRHTTVHA